ncbi:branched-chain amino acid ABC transporter permease [Tardiphaga sp. P9-11]|jgi:branched-chain amino acid transport system permease protein|uniref:branched-chain amino acid ABC transporter permease n=1 Tax=Tardiphaga sp. P9-11 TaxID=2024614 RepID=UPI0011F0BBF6|nr:branched-chain amino acid ABC transporter permease [Tardiphaga sp. P9-11]KAA0074975.1 branched-chain amino acid ABC transporter permease [Tardiphaga sp. P9-11]
MLAALRHRYGILLVLAVIIAALPLVFPSSYYFRVASLVWVSAFAAIGLNILMGKAGQVSLGHAGFFGIGAYAVAIGPTHLGVPPLAAMLLGCALSALLAFLVGRPILRLKGHYLAIATLGFGVLVALVITTESRWTGGPDGMSVMKLTLFGWRASGSDTWYWITGGLLLAGTWIALNLDETPTGRAFRALHDSEIAARVTGINVNRFKLQAFVIAAVYASLAGSALALMNGFVNPDQAGFLHSIEMVTMVVLGGLGSVVGSIVGAAVLIMLPQLLTVFQEYENLMLGAIIIVSMIFMRDGIVPVLSKFMTGWRA